jgi:hypothetical protein
MRETIFVSHATPEDNDFTIWLASRLELMGYKVWIDKKELLGGETFWTDIEIAITKDAIKFLLVYSKNICCRDQPGVVKEGIRKEIDYAKSTIQANPELKDFLTILHVDEAPYDLFPGSKDLNHIPFVDNWAEGLTQLLKKLEKDSVPKPLPNTGKSAQWYLDQYLVKNPIIEKKELYYTNWWAADELPGSFYILQFTNERQAKVVQANNVEILLVRSANCIVSFRCDLDFDIETEGDVINVLPAKVFEISIEQLMTGFEREAFPTSRDAANQFKKLLKRTLHLYLRAKNLSWYELASKELAYFHTAASLPTSKVEFTFPFQPDKKKKKNLLGKYLTVGKWHFALSFKPVLHPFIGFQLKAHIVFTNKEFKSIEDKDLQHAYRRNKGKRMFNEEWRDLLIAFINSLRNVAGKIRLDTNTAKDLNMMNMVEMYWSAYGYLDPKDIERQSILITNDRDEDEPTLSQT